MRIAVVANTFPVLSEQFIVQHVDGLLKAGLDVVVCTRVPEKAQGGSKRLEIPAPLSRAIRYWKAPSGLTLWPRLFLPAAGQPKNQTRAFRRLVQRSLLHELPRTPGRSKGLSLWRIRELLEHYPVDLVHVHFGDVALDYASLQRLPGAPPLVVSFHGYDANVKPRLPSPPNYAPLFSTASAVTTSSQFLRGRVIGLGAPESQVHVVPMGADTQAIEFRPRTLDSGPLRVLSVGRLIEAKGFEYAIAALALCKERGLRVHYRLAGGGELSAELKALSAKLRVTEQIEFAGAVPHRELARSYAWAQVFLMPSVRAKRGDEESQGLVLQEAQAAGLPVIATDVGGIAEGLVPDVTGLLVAPRDPEALAAALCQIANSSERWAEMGARGRELVERKFSVGTMTERFLRLYKSLLGDTHC